MITRTVTREQAALLASAEQAKAQAIQHAATIANAMCAGLVPDGAQLVDINTDTGVLTFHVARSGGDDAE